MRKFLSLDASFIMKHDLDKSELLLFAVLQSIATNRATHVIDGQAWYQISRLDLIDEAPFITDKPDTIYRVMRRLEDKDLILLTKAHGTELYAFTPQGLEWGMDSKYIRKKHRNSDDRPNHSDDRPNHSDDRPKTPYIVGGKEYSGGVHHNERGVSVLFEGYYKWGEVPDEAVNRIFSFAEKYGVPEDRMSEFSAYLERGDKQFTVKSTGPIAGLRDVVEVFLKKTRYA